MTLSCWTSPRWTNSGSECSIKVTLEIAISESRRGENSGSWLELILFGWVSWSVLTWKSTKRSSIHINIYVMIYYLKSCEWCLVMKFNLKIIFEVTLILIYKISLHMNVYLIDWYFETPEESLTINYQNKTSYTGRWKRN